MLDICIINNLDHVIKITINKNSLNKTSVEFISKQDLNSDIIFYNENLKNDLANIFKNKNSLEEILTIVPIESIQKLLEGINSSIIDNSPIENISYKVWIKSLLPPIFSKFAFSNNLTLLDSFVEQIKQTSQLIYQDRVSCFEHLWSLIKTNTAAYDAYLIYNIIHKTKKNKTSLTQNMVHGKNMPLTSIEDTLATDMYNNYNSKITDSFELIEYNQEENSFVLAGTIHNNKFMFMGKSLAYSILQEKILKAIINGINENNKN